jgi:hypothetical protein
MVPLKAVLGRGGYLAPVQAMIEQVAATGEPYCGTTADGRRQLMADPLISFAGAVNAVYAWAGLAGEERPPRAVAGAWYFNKSTGLFGGSDDLLDLRGGAAQDRRHERLTAEAFTRLLPNTDESLARALLVRAKPGLEHQATWTVRRDDGELRAVMLACRVVEEAGDGGRTEVVVRGVTQDLGPPRPLPPSRARCGWHSRSG